MTGKDLEEKLKRSLESQSHAERQLKESEIFKSDQVGSDCCLPVEFDSPLCSFNRCWRLRDCRRTLSISRRRAERWCAAILFLLQTDRF